VPDYPASEQPPSAGGTPPPRLVNLALGGGGVKGLVHVGVLQELAEQDVEIVSIVGTSIGALIGALFAYKRSIKYGNLPTLVAQRSAAQAVEVLCAKTDFNEFRDLGILSLLRRGLFRGQAIEDWLKTQLWLNSASDGVRLIDLPFDLTVTATDLWTGNALVLNRATAPALHVHKAVRASISIQGIFRDIAIEFQGKEVRCWDGGTTGNCRFDIAALRNPDLDTIAVSLTYRGSVVSTDTGFLTAWKRPLRIAGHSASILMRQLEELTNQHFRPTGKGQIRHVQPDLGDVGTLDFGLSVSKKKELFKNGRIAVGAVLQSMFPKTKAGP
jgi:predicted acylesterase/phospholipase RssA